MSEATSIEWCDSTFNPWIGCTPVSPACDDCYAERSTAARALGVKWGAKEPRHRTSAANWKQPLRWNAQAAEFQAKHGRRQRVFCASLADVFDNAVVNDWRGDLWALIEATPNLDWLLTTKRIGNVRAMVPTAWLEPGAWPANVRIIITVATQEEADRDIPKLLALGCPNGLSMEPLLGPVDLNVIDINGDAEIYPLRGTTECVDDEGGPAPYLPAIEWVIVGGESGHQARPMHPDWARSLRDQCATAGVPFLFKQWGTFMPVSIPIADFHRPTPERVGEMVVAGGGQQATVMRRLGKAAAGRLLDGRTHDGFPSTGGCYG